MRFVEIKQHANDLPGALVKAIADVPELKTEHQDAELALAKAEMERQRWTANYGYFVSAIPTLQEKYKSAKKRVMTLEAESAGKGDTASGWTNYRRFKAEYQQAVDSFAYLSLWPQPDAERAYIVAEIEERTAYANLAEAMAVRARLGAIVALSEVDKFDPGFQVAFEKPESEDGVGVNLSWSSVEMDKVKQIREKTLPSLQEQLAAHDSQVARNRADMNVSVWA